MNVIKNLLRLFFIVNFLFFSFPSFANLQNPLKLGFEKYLDFNKKEFVPGQIIIQLTKSFSDFHNPKQSPYILDLIKKDLFNDLFSLHLSSDIKITPAFEGLSNQLKSGLSFEEIIQDEQQNLAVKNNIDNNQVNEKKILENLASTYLLQVDSSSDIPKVCEVLKQNGICRYAEPNWKMNTFANTPNDPYLSSKGSWNQPYDDLWGVKTLEAPEAWEQSTGKDTVIAIVDTGIDYTHSDLAPNIWKNSKEIPNNGIDDDNNGYIDDSIGWDVSGADIDDPNDMDKDPIDSYGHGTHVAGIAGAAGNNNVGIIGVAYQSKLMAVKVFPDRLPFGSLLDIARGIEYATRNGADIINVSLGGPRSHLLEDAATFAELRGVVVIAAAGNSGISTESVSPSELNSVITVGAYKPNLERASFSNIGPKLDVMAPGTDILSCLATNSAIIDSAEAKLFVVTAPDGSKYLRLSGTSMAAPHVAGIAALLRSRFRHFNNEQIRQVLRGSTNQGTSLENRFNSPMGYGRVSAGLAIKQAQSSEPLVVHITSPIPYKYFYNSEKIRITGTITGTEFESYSIEVGTGNVPTQWTSIATANKPITNSEIVTWTPDLSVKNSIYTIRIVALNKTGFYYLDQVFIYLINDKDLKPGWPIALGGSTLSNAAVVDLDGDGFMEIVVEGLSAFNDGKLYVMNHNGEPFGDGWPKSVNQMVQGSPAVGDLNNDGKMEIVTIGYQPGPTVYAYDCYGNTISGFPVTLNNFNTISPLPLSSPTIADIDGDGRPEILVIGGGFTETKPPNITIINSLGKIVWNTPLYGVMLSKAQKVINVGACTPMVGDITGDSSPEIVVAYSRRQENTESFYTSYFAYDNRGTLLRGWPVTLGPNDLESSLVNVGALADINNDGKLDVIVGSDPKGEATNPQLAVINGEGHLLNGWPQTSSALGHIVAPPCIGDLNKDGKPEIIARTSSQLLAYNGDGSLVKGFPVTISSGFSYSPPVIGDIDSDGFPEILFSGSSLTPSSDQNYYLFAYHGNGLPGEGWPKTIIASKQTPYIWSGFTLGDIDKDGKVDAVFPAFERIYTYQFSGSYRRENIPWGTFQQNPQHTGALK